VLETSALKDIAQVSRDHRLPEIGVSFALDDFGTGYSSLTYLKRLPAQSSRSTRAFVRDMLDDPDDLAILEGVLGLATAFRRQVIAEGVETEHEMRTCCCSWAANWRRATASRARCPQRLGAAVGNHLGVLAHEFADAGLVFFRGLVGAGATTTVRPRSWRAETMDQDFTPPV
jgi:predicted signal transduction protein with EAL and GGDEF domain